MPFRLILFTLAAALVLGPAQSSAEERRARAGEVDTEHAFGNTTGADTEEPGAFVPHLVLPTRLGKTGGTFVLNTPSLELKYGVVEGFSASLSLRGLAAHVRGVPGIADVSGGAVTGVGLQGRYRVLDRATAPVGFTIQAGITTDHRDITHGRGGRNDGFDFRLAFDAEPVFDQWIVAANVIGTSGRSRPAGGPDWQFSSLTGLALASTFRVAPNVWIGGEAQYLRSYAGSTFGRFEGDALSIGPTIYFVNGPGWVTLSWTAQVAGREIGGSNRGLNLRDFDRHQVLLVIGRRL